MFAPQLLQCFTRWPKLATIKFCLRFFDGLHCLPIIYLCFQSAVGFHAQADHLRFAVNREQYWLIRGLRIGNDADVRPVNLGERFRLEWRARPADEAQREPCAPGASVSGASERATTTRGSLRPSVHEPTVLPSRQDHRGSAAVQSAHARLDVGGARLGRCVDGGHRGPVEGGGHGRRERTPHPRRALVLDEARRPPERNRFRGARRRRPERSPRSRRTPRCPSAQSSKCAMASIDTAVSGFAPGVARAPEPLAPALAPAVVVTLDAAVARDDGEPSGALLREQPGAAMAPRRSSAAQRGGHAAARRPVTAR